jgi:hypothetical protein
MLRSGCHGVCAAYTHCVHRRAGVQVITGSSDGALRIISILPNKLLGLLGEHAADVPVERLALRADRRMLASSSHDTVVRLWDLGPLLDEGCEDAEEDADREKDGCAGTADRGDQVEQPPVGARAAGEGEAEVQQDPVPQSFRATGLGEGSDDSSDSEGGGAQGKKRKRAKRDRTRMTNARNRPKDSKTNFFADLL